MFCHHTDRWPQLDHFIYQRRLSAVAMPFWSTVLNGVLAPPLIALVTKLTSDHSVMGEHVNPPLLKWLGWTTAGAMTAAAAAMLWT